MKEFIDNYLGIDSKMAHSAIPFLIKPGNLTNRFQEGKIKHFIHPIRLYFVMSLFYFFTISFLLSGIDLRLIDDEDIKVSGDTRLMQMNTGERWKLVTDDIKLKAVPDSLVNLFSGIETFDQFYDSLSSKIGIDSIEKFSVSIKPTTLPPVEERKVEKFHRLARDKRRISDEAFMDSLAYGSGLMESNFLDPDQRAHFFSQVRKIFENDEGFKGFVLGNLPLMMFILIPLFAGVLKFIYVRRKHLYIKHIVHSLHVHSFAYLTYGLGLLLMFKVFTPGNFPNLDITSWRVTIGIITFVLVSTYVYISFLKVYGQGWFKTLIKFNIVGYVYSFFLFVFFSLEVFISFWYYNG
ncbi:hypothetical protein BFP71_09915 [Roseivirga misakiensis]|uniref:DUF3667 domain-containing protein n=2 Tax=Roseivirga misakiensis TaxID=1563681 RepID=A0A1E5SLD5_9BACT|nr:hypothetical protein BFP71_09915 [Roseivirga misakiensis]